MSQISLQELYVAYFDRAADPAGLNYWLSQEAIGTTDATIALQFVPQLETLQIYPLLNTPALLQANPSQQQTFINAVYQNLFGHAADTAGLSYWQGQLTAGASPGFMVAQIIYGALGTDATTILNRATVAEEYTNAVASAVPAITWNPTNDTPQSRAVINTVNSTSASVLAAAPLIAADIAIDESGSNGSGVTLTLANGNQTFSPTSGITGTQTTANNDTVRGVLGGLAPGASTGSQLTTSDSLNGGGGVNTLSTVLDNEAVVNPVMQNMQIVNLAPGVANQTFNASSSVGVTTLSVAGGIFGAGDGEVVGTTLNVTGLGTGMTVGMMNASAYNDNLTASFTGLSGTNNSATLALNNNAGGGTFDTTLSGGIGVNTYNVQSTGAQANSVTIGSQDTALSTINVSGGDVLTMTNTNPGVTTYNGSGATGNQTFISGALAGKATITGGSGNDTLNASAATKAVTMSDGSGADTLIFNGAVAGNVISAGTGSDLAQTGGNTGLSFISGADLTTNATLVGDVNVLNGYTAGSTKIDLSGLTGAGYAYDSTLTQTQLGAATSASSLLAAVNVVAGLINAQTLTKQVVAFAFGGNEYVYQDKSGAAGVASGDGLLQVTGAASTFRTSDLSLA